MFPHKDVNKAVMSAEEFRFEAKGRGLGFVLMSNPSNPTGQAIEGDELDAYVRVAREDGISIIMDEFYSHYLTMAIMFLPPTVEQTTTVIGRNPYRVLHLLRMLTRIQF